MKKNIKKRVLILNKETISQLQKEKLVGGQKLQTKKTLCDSCGPSCDPIM